MCQDEWDDLVGNGKGKSFNWDEHGLTDAYDELFKIAHTRNACYSDDHLYNSVEIKNENTSSVDVESLYPPNTKGYYRIEYSWLDAYVYQSPMFLMKYFAYLAQLNGLVEQLGPALNYLQLAPYLRNIQTQLIQTVLGGIEHPHLPETYYLLTTHINASDF